MITTFIERARGGRGLAAHRLHPQQRPARAAAELHDPLEPLRAPRLPGAAERPRSTTSTTSTKDGDVHADPDVAVRASAARATAASTTPRATAPPARRCARSTATRSRSATGTSSSASRSRVSKVDGHRRVARRSTSGRYAFPGEHVDGPESWLYPIQPPALMAAPMTPPAGADPVSARLARGALGPRRRDQVLPLPEGPGRRQLVPDARLGDADRVPRPGDHRRDPRDVLQARPRRGLRVDPAHHERPLGRLARARHAPLGRVASSSS